MPSSVGDCTSVWCSAISRWPEVVQQRGRDQRIARARLLGEPRALQRVLQLRHRLARVGDPAAFGEQAGDLCEVECHESETEAGAHST
jgi:hypothetical protein